MVLKITYIWDFTELSLRVFLSHHKMEDYHMTEISNSIYNQRTIEAQILKPIIEGLLKEFDEEAVMMNIRKSIEGIAFRAGEKYKERVKDNNLKALAKRWDELSSGGSLRIESIKLDDCSLSFNVTRCKYAELYENLGISKWGEVLSCCRDKAFLEGLSSNIRMHRYSCIMNGDSTCCFKFSQSG